MKDDVSCKRKVDDNSYSQAPTSTPKSARKKKEELEIRYTKYGRKMYVNLSNDRCDEDYHDEKEDNNR